MKHGSLFSGIGGFDLASQWMGWDNIFHCELNEFGQQILKYYWPNAITYEDITKTDFSIHRGQIDILTGGFPCQPYSTAGKRLGTADDRHLWPQMLRAIRQIKPKYIVGENVSGLLSWNRGMVFNEVQTDLETEGYEVQPVVLPACAVNAPHRRDRIWFVAYSNQCAERSPGKGGKTKTARSKNNDEQIGRGEQTKQHIRPGNVFGPNTNTACQSGKWMQPKQRETSAKKQREFRGNGGQVECDWDVTNAQRKRQQKQRKSEQPLYSEKNRQWKASWSYDDGRWPTQSPICRRDDGFPGELDGITFPRWRQESVKGYGNAIVPQIAFEIFKVIDVLNCQ